MAGRQATPVIVGGENASGMEGGGLEAGAGVPLPATDKDSRVCALPCTYHLDLRGDYFTLRLQI